MKDHTQRQLRQELLATGASAAEIKKLLPIASTLSLLKGSTRPATNGSQKTGRWLNRRTSLTLAASGVAVGICIIISQTVLPTSPLYPVQKLSDSIAVYMHPRYRASIMMKRARQVHQLVADHAGSPQVLATLTDYTREADAYKSLPHANYAAFEYCKTNLQQAATIAPPRVRQAIANSLQSLETT